MVGTTSLQAGGDHTVHWSETGLLHRPGRAPLPVSRRLRVVRREEGWWVLFDHGGDFHPWSPGVEVEHRCGADHYRGRVEVASATAWTVTWRVGGPTKDYTMRSQLTRAPG